MRTVTGVHERRRALTKGERTRERLLRAAITRFGEDGYRATSVSQLSRDAGLTPAAAYAYFDDKESFWAVAVNADLDQLRDEILPVVGGDTPVIAMVLAMIEGLQRHALARRVLVEGERDDLDLVLGHPLFANMTRQIARTLAARQQEGRLSDAVAADQLALGLETTIFGLVLFLVRAGVDEHAERFHATVALLQFAVGGPPTPDERRL